LKARLCVAGADQLYAYCEQRSIPHARCGKLIVALNDSELPGLDELERRGRANGVPGLRRVDAAGIRTIEPHCRGVAGLHSPNTGVVDFAFVAAAFAEDLLHAGGSLVTGCEIQGVQAADRSVRLQHHHGVTEATHAIFCGGAWPIRTLGSFPSAARTCAWSQRARRS
jgi:2-hydroxyglutarate dehydrogenase